MKPTKSYRVWHSARVGSSLLCRYMEDTGLAGRPGEHLTLHGHPSLCDKYDVNTYEDLRNHVWQLGSSNGIFAAKVGAHMTYHREIVEEICTLRGMTVPDQYEEIWSDLFPNCKHIVILRQNKFRQAVSWWKAIQDNEWHLRGNEKRRTPPEFYVDKFDAAALTHLFQEASFIDAAAQEYLTKHGLSYKVVVYEELISDAHRVVNDCLQYLDLTNDDISLPVAQFSRTADEHSEIWVKRLQDHLQKDWDKRVV